MTHQIHQRLRAATSAEHRRLESRLAVHDQISDRTGRAALVARYWRFHAAAETALAPWLRGLEGLDFEGRRRTGVLRRDFADLGLAPPARPAAASVANLGAALGLMYVVEGSALGGRVIRREVARRGHDFIGLGFLDPYGSETGERWRSFLEVLARETQRSEDAEAAVDGARAGFRHAEDTLCEVPADV